MWCSFTQYQKHCCSLPDFSIFCTCESPCPLPPETCYLFKSYYLFSITGVLAFTISHWLIFVIDILMENMQNAKKYTLHHVNCVNRKPSAGPEISYLNNNSVSCPDGRQIGWNSSIMIHETTSSNKAVKAFPQLCFKFYEFHSSWGGTEWWTWAEVPINFYSWFDYHTINRICLCLILVK